MTTVRGVRAVANDIAVRLTLPRSDADIARDAAFALNLRESVPRTVKAIVHNRHITLTGPVDWMFQKTQAEKLVRHIPGVVGVFNHIGVLPRAGVRDVRKRIVQALHRSADVNARQVEVTVDGEVATLTGTVGSWLQREAAERAAGSAPGITCVDNRITIVPTFVLEDMPEEAC
jgi:osmotically-inducible protein OsmY